MSNIRKDLTWRQCYHLYMLGHTGLSGRQEFKGFLWWFFVRFLPLVVVIGAAIAFFSRP